MTMGVTSPTQGDLMNLKFTFIASAVAAILFSLNSNSRKTVTSQSDKIERLQQLEVDIFQTSDHFEEINFAEIKSQIREPRPSVGC